MEHVPLYKELHQYLKDEEEFKLHINDLKEYISLANKRKYFDKEDMLFSYDKARKFLKKYIIIDEKIANLNEHINVVNLALQILRQYCYTLENGSLILRSDYDPHF